jgi:hypothetical protein
MLILPTSATTAIVFDLMRGQVGEWLAYITAAVLLAGAFCAWETLFSSINGRPPSRARWIALSAALGLFALSVLAEKVLTGFADFNGGEVSTLWGYAVAPWFVAASVLCILTLVVLRIVDATRADAFARVPAVAWWFVGCLAASAYGAASVWAGMLSPVYALVSVEIGYALAIAGVGSLVAAAVLRVLGRTGKTTAATGGQPT